MTRRTALAAAGALSLAAAAKATAQMSHGPDSGRQAAVSVDFSSYVPARLEVLVGDTVRWTNDSVRKHTVTANDGSFDSGQLETGASFERSFDRRGAAAYYCRLHAGIVGEVDVHGVLLDPAPETAAPGRAYPLHGRVASSAGGTVAIEADSGAGFKPVATVSAAQDGTFSASVSPTTTTSYRAVAGAEASPPRRVLVLDRTVTATARRTTRRLTVSTRVLPAARGARVVLQLRLPERFGWWPVRSAVLGPDSRATFRVPLRRRVAARVVLTLRDGATVLAVSRTLAPR